MPQSKPPSANLIAGGGFAWSLFASSALALLACSIPAERADSTATSAAKAACLDAGPTGTVRVRPDSIGRIPSTATFAELRVLCPNARDTTLPEDGGTPALLIPAPTGAAVLAIQFAIIARPVAGRRIANEAKPASLWSFAGPAIELPGGLRGDARWSEVVRRYGPALAEPGRARLTTRLCALMGFAFRLDLPALDTSSFAIVDSLSTRVPSDARITEITLLPGAPEPPARECGGHGPYLDPEGAERHAIATSNGMVRRVGDTLFIRSADGMRVTLVTKPESNDMQVTYTYAGRVANGTLHRIDVQGWEIGWTTYVHAATGKQFDTIGDPIFSPNGSRLASSAYVMETCESTARLEIYRLTDTIPALEFEIEPRDCITDTGWAPRDLAWLSPDTLAFIADSRRPTDAQRATPSDTGRYLSRWMLAVRDGNGWRIVARR